MVSHETEWNIILDVDGTLVEETHDVMCLPKPRPYLGEFFTYIFSHFSRISLWSAASPEWIDPIVKEILLPLVPVGFSFHFIWAGKCVSRGIQSSRGCDYTVRITKDIRKVFKQFPMYTVHNTLILDDTPSTYRLNYGNAIGIRSYTCNTRDEELLDLIRNVEKWKQEFKECGTVRHIHKGS